jgi:hypothetical protein
MAGSASANPASATLESGERATTAHSAFNSVIGRQVKVSMPATVRHAPPSAAPSVAPPRSLRPRSRLRRHAFGWVQCAAVDIEEFYDADPRRRSSAEVELGEDWHDAHGVRYELSWVEDTGELYVMREPVPGGWVTPFGGIHVFGAHSVDEQEVEGMTVAVVGTVGTRREVDRILSGWEGAMPASDSVAWLVGRLRDEGVLPVGPAPGTL